MDILREALQQGIAPAIVITVYLLITKIIDANREKSQAKISQKIADSINTISNFIIDTTKSIIDKDKEKCKKAIENSMFSAGMNLTNFVISTITTNHLDTNKETIVSNIKNIVNAEYYTIYSELCLYKVNDVLVSEYLNKNWMEIIENDMYDAIFNESLNSGDKIMSFSNKIKIELQSYITYIINNALNEY